MIKTIEERSINAWPALQTMINDGWVLRFADGYTKRANSVYPLYASSIGEAGSSGVEAKITDCERWYRERELPVVYKMTPATVPPDLDYILDQKGYRKEGSVSVQLLDLAHRKEVPSMDHIRIHETFNKKWIDDFSRLNHVPGKHIPTMNQMLSRIVPQTGYVSVVQDGQTIACGLGVLEGKYIGLFDIVTDSQYRRRGFGERVLLSLLNWGKQNGAETAYLQVALENVRAVRLYSKQGFRERYQYWYRIKK